METMPHGTAACARFVHLARPEWTAARSRHEARVDQWIKPHLSRASAGQKHPVYDFLFEYYSQRPGQLRRWHPGIGTIVDDAPEFAERPHYRSMEGGFTACSAGISSGRREQIRSIRDLLALSGSRSPFFGCFGFHEWAMVYRAADVRHPAWPLRFPAAEISRIVESAAIRCSHHDAFRFFTPAARPLNRQQPTRDEASQFEQPGCLHANMDLYKWSYKLSPFASSEIMADAFALAFDIREVDMRASPYDFSALGFEPIPIESADGRATYEDAQRSFTDRGRPIRSALIQVCDRILEIASCD